MVSKISVKSEGAKSTEKPPRTACGPEVHRPPQNIIDEVKRLADAGVREVTLLGQTINHYHYKHGDGREGKKKLSRGHL